MVLMPSLFGTSGIRGDAEKLFTHQFCFDLGRTFASFLTKHNQAGAVAIGMDPRHSSPRIKESIITGLTHEGREVLDEGATCVPSMNYILKVDTHIVGSIMVSGSHIKPHLNGVKFFAFGEEILKDHEAQIEKIYTSLKGKINAPRSETKSEQEENRANTEYQEMLVAKASEYPAWRVVVDCGDGAQSDTMPQVLKRLRLEVVELNTTIQGEFFSRDTEVEKDFAELKRKVVTEKCDFGVGYDSDGDRAVFIDEKGNYIPGDYTGALIAKEAKGDTVVTPINTSAVVEKIGKKVVRTKVGSPHVVAAMKENGALFGFEANGGGIFAEMHSRDGGRTTIEVLNILAKSGKKLSELIGELPKYFIERDKVEYKWELKKKIIEEAKNHFSGVKTDETDGLKIWMDEDSWILFRSSANAPEFRVFAESKFEPVAKKLLRDGLALVERVVKNDKS